LATERNKSEKEQELHDQLEQKDKERQSVKDQLDRERLLRVTGDVIKAITAPAFVEKMRLARVEFEAGKGLDVGAKILSIEGLREAGVDIPTDFRLTSRVFEDHVEGTRLEIKSEKSPGPELGASWGACAGAGGPLISCGCAGWKQV
jgi:hypothetical protein